MGDATNAAALTATGQVAATGINAMATESANKKNREWNEMMYDKQKQDAIAMWQMQNQYNSPQEQMRRLKAAGLNPNLVYGNGTVANNASTPQTPKAPASDWVPFKVDTNMVGDIVNTYYNVQRQKQELDNLKVQHDLIESQKFYTDVKAITEGFKPANIEADTAGKKQSNEQKATSFPVTLEKMFADLAAVKANTMLTEVKTRFTENEDKRQTEMQAINIQQKVQNIALMKLQGTKIESEKQKIEASIKLINSQAYLNYLEGTLREKYGMSYGDNLEWRLAAKAADMIEEKILGIKDKTKEEKQAYYEKIEKFEKIGPKY